MSAEGCAQKEAHENHKWLKQFTGDWTFESNAEEGPDQPARKFTGEESVKTIGDLWIVAEGRGEMPDGQTGRMMMTLGFDPQQDCFVGSWVGSMMMNLWIYRGSLDPERRILTLDTEGPGMSGGTARYQDIHEIVSPDHRILRSQMLGEDGQWTKFNEAHYYRQQVISRRIIQN